MGFIYWPILGFLFKFLCIFTNAINELFSGLWYSNIKHLFSICYSEPLNNFSHTSLLCSYSYQ